MYFIILCQETLALVFIYREIILVKYFLNLAISKILFAVCRYGDRKMIDCNSCECSNGKWSCTENVCPPIEGITFELFS